jgi:type III restriction enzyme
MTSAAVAHPSVEYDEELVQAIASRLTLRRPNAEGLQRLASRFGDAAGEPFEAICEIATAVGKTYLAAGLIEYLSAQGVRNILILTPGRTVLQKTIANFTPGHRNAVPGLESQPLLITADNLKSGFARAAFADANATKLFVFTVQSLLEPPADMARRTRDYQEWLGQAFVDYLVNVPDLVIIGDEHHVYADSAEAFSSVLSELRPMAIVGLTATAADSQQENIVYRYSLAAALNDRLVKTPVIVGRTDSNTDLVTQLSDGLTLLAAKQKLAGEQARVTGTIVNPVMLVVAERIDQAEQVKEILGRPALLGDSAEAQVLVVHSQSNDEALAQLAAVEEQDSPIRVIVSVSMLKEGWDVKNVYVIASLRPSVSDTLTEQTLGRGLRLPYGKPTGIELLDTLEVLSHDRYERLLKEAERLIVQDAEERLAESPAQAPVLPAQIGEPGSAVGPSRAAVDVTSGTWTESFFVNGNADAVVDVQPEGALHAAAPGGAILVAEATARIEQAQAEAAKTWAVPTVAGRSVRLPLITRMDVARNFSLAEIDDDTFAEIGRQVASAHTAKLDRKLLEVVEKPGGGFALAPRPGQKIDATVVELPYGDVKRWLVQALVGMDFVPNTPSSRNGAERLVDAAIAGAGGEDRLGAYFSAAKKLMERVARAAFKTSTVRPQEIPSVRAFEPQRMTDRRREPNRFGPFDRKAAYGPWERSLHPYNWFDSEPERKLANLLDSDLGDAGVVIWCRVLRGELDIQWSGGRYTPDFYAEIGQVNYLLEVKADRDVERGDVRAKKEAARRLARLLTDEGNAGTWRYLLIAQADLNNIGDLADLLRISSAT